jgi:hypothetical protein
MVAICIEFARTDRSGKAGFEQEWRQETSGIEIIIDSHCTRYHVGDRMRQHDCHTHLLQ